VPSPKVTVAQQQFAVLSDVVKGLTGVKILPNATEPFPPLCSSVRLWHGTTELLLSFSGNECKEKGESETARGSKVSLRHPTCFPEEEEVPDPLPDQRHTRWCSRKAGIEVFDLIGCL